METEDSTMPDAPVVRVTAHKNGGYGIFIWNNDKYKLNSLKLPSLYLSFDAMPEWLQNKLRVLSVLHAPPPRCRVKGVGQRMSNEVYWVEVDDSD